VQCGLEVRVEGSRVVGVAGDAAHPISQGYACAKGRSLDRFHHHPERLCAPRLGQQDVSWNVLLDDLAETLRRVVGESGPDAVGFYHGTWSWMDTLGRRTTERLARQLGSRSVYSAVSVDAISRSYVSEQMSGRAMLIPNFALDETELLVLIGTNPIVSHGHSSGIPRPAAALRGVMERGAVWVVDPRESETARAATHHLAIRAGSDHVLLAGLVRALLEDGADQAALAERATGIPELAEAVAPFDLDRVSRECDVPASRVLALAQAIRETPRFAVATGTGVTMAPNSTVTEWLVWCLQIVAGSFDRPGGMWFNPGQLLRLDERDWAPLWDTKPEVLESRPDLPLRYGERPCAGLADEIESGGLRALFVIGGNPVASLPEAGRLVPALRCLEALAVADVIPSDTQQLATHTLAVAGQLERADTTQYADLFASTRSAQFTPALVPLGGERKPMWWVMAQIARRLGFDVLDGLDPDATDDTELLTAMVKGRLTVGEAANVMLSDVPRPRGWVEQRVLPDGRWRLSPEDLVEQLGRAEVPRTPCFVPRRAVGRMNSAFRDISARDEAVHLHPEDAAAAGVADGESIVVESESGRLQSRVHVSERVRPGVVSIPHGLVANVNQLTTGRAGHVEPATGMVHQSGIPVRLARASDAD
jgi:anaerobic selenocysteine-containing dehydrogenase